MEKGTVNVLLAEDDRNLGNILKNYLDAKGYNTTLCVNGQEAVDVFGKKEIDFVILDIMMPVKDGFAAAKEIRSINRKVPVLFLTAKALQEDKLKGFEAGADDYLTKPFAFEELLARTQALGRRPHDSINSELSVGGLTLNVNTYEVKRDGESVTLSAKEFVLLECLMRHSNKTLTKDQIINYVWNYDSDILPNTVEVFIGYLRNKIDKPFKNKTPLICTVRGFGYRIG